MKDTEYIKNKIKSLINNLNEGERNKIIIKYLDTIKSNHSNYSKGE